jgi:dihydrofolate reductase
MDLTIIAAISENNIIGVNGKLPWRIKEDMKRFKELTTNHSVIMGRKTYLSIPEKFRPLPDRKNIILSTTLEPQEGIYIARTIEEAIELAEGVSAFVAGGEKVYESFLPQSTKMELTRVHGIYEGDAHFPNVNWSDWILLSKMDCSTENEIPYSFLTYRRR